MGLKENYSELYKDEPIHTHVKTERERFEIELNNLVKETFKDVKLNTRRVTSTVDIRTGKIITKNLEID